MEKILDKILAKGTPPDRGDIGELLASIGEPGMNQEAKKEAVKRLYEESGQNPQGFQGLPIWEALNSWAEY